MRHGVHALSSEARVLLWDPFRPGVFVLFQPGASSMISSTCEAVTCERKLITPKNHLIQCLQWQLHALHHDSHVWCQCCQLMTHDVSWIICFPRRSHDTIGPLCEIVTWETHEDWRDFLKFHTWLPEHEHYITVSQHQLPKCWASIVMGHPQSQGHMPPSSLSKSLANPPQNQTKSNLAQTV